MERFLELKQKFFPLAGLVILSVAGLMAGAYFHQTMAALMFAVWLGLEAFDVRLPFGERHNRGRLSRLASLLTLYSRSDEASETLLFEKISELRIEGELTEQESRWLERLRDLMELRALVFGKPMTGKRGLRQAFAYRRELPGDSADAAPLEGLSLQDITESATVVADLYWKLYDTGRGEYADLTKMARRLFSAIFEMEFESDATKAVIEALTDKMQRHNGLPFVILNCLRKQQSERARGIAQFLLGLDDQIEEEVRSSLYWISEIHSFARERKKPISDYETTIRYLYHLCFTEPDRAGFLEIDSQFFSQFETVNELAREGFLFKDTLLEKVLGTWEEYEGLFDVEFRTVLEALTQKKSKIYNERENWVRFWKREGEDFSRDYLYIVEGNLAYASGYLDDAVAYYQKALELNTRSRAARLNLIFCYAKLGAKADHERQVLSVVSDPTLYPSCLYVVGNSYLLLGDEARAEAYYEQLEEQPGWGLKTEYYKSTFCYENGLYELALQFARRAHRKNPTDSAINYHLSLCYNALGEKDEALAMVKRMGEAPQWLNYYRFTLERDAGRHSEASETLLRIPSEYFEDPDEWEEALDFARGQKDLTLLRHLKKRG